MSTPAPAAPPIEIRVVGPAPYSQEYLAAIIGLTDEAMSEIINILRK